MVVANQTGNQTSTIWQIDPSHSLVEFGVKHMMFTTVKGRFAGLSGQIVTDGENPALGTVEIEIDVASIDTRDEGRDEHLRSDDFFGAASYPTIAFRTTRVEPGKNGNFRVIGDLTIRDLTNEVVLDAAFNGRATTPWGYDVASYTATTEINRKDYGLTWNAALETGGVVVGETVKIHLEVEAKPAA